MASIVSQITEVNDLVDSCCVMSIRSGVVLFSKGVWGFKCMVIERWEFLILSEASCIFN